MANFAYQEFKRGLFEAEFDLHATDDIRFKLLMATTTFDTETTIQYIGDLVGTTGYYAGTGVDANGEALDNEDVVIASGNARFDADDEVVGSVGAGSGNCVALLFFKWITDLSGSAVMFYVDSGTNIPFNGSGGDITFEWSSSGIAELS